MDLPEFLRQTDPIAQRQANKMSQRLGKARSIVNRDALYHEAIVKLIQMYKDETVNFDNAGWLSFCEISIWGQLKNILKKLWRDGATFVTEADAIPQEDEDLLGIEDLAYCYTGQGFDSENENQVRRFLLEAIREYLDSLDHEDRFVFISHRVDGKSLEDIGRILGFSREKARRKSESVKEGLLSFLEANGWTKMDITESS